MLRIEDFLPSYADYEPNKAFTTYSQDMYDVVQAKQEFAELVLGADEAPTGTLQTHQRFVQRFMSGNTPYDALLLWHDVGTGKTLSALAVAEGMKNFNQSYRKALVLVRSDLFFDNIRNELVKMYPDEYAPDTNLQGSERARRLNRLVRQYYDLDTFQVFAKTIQAMFDAGQEAEVRDTYSNRVILIDEAHNVRIRENGGGTKTYDTLHQFLHTVQNCKILLLSATPVRDTVDEFASLMNLILPAEQQLPTGNAFVKTYFEQEVLIEEKKVELQNLIKGRISYLRQVKSSLRVDDVGVRVDVTPFPLVRLVLQGQQLLGYLAAREKDGVKGESRIVLEDDDESAEADEAEEEAAPEVDAAAPEVDAAAVPLSSLFKNTRAASLYVNVAGKYGPGSANTDILQRTLTGGAKLDEKDKLERLKAHAVKYHYLLELLGKETTKREKVFVYSKVVAGSGLNALAAVLRQFRYVAAQGNEQNTGLRYALITGNTPKDQIERLLQAFNHERNKHGAYIRVLLGSTKLGEGRSLTAVRHIVLMTPYWNFTDMDQAIGRGIRFGSHRMLDPADRSVTIHRLCAYTMDGQPTIDEKMYKEAYAKDRLTKQVEVIARAIAVDCTFNQARNEYAPDRDDSRECLYRECAYTCARIGTMAPITDTYNLFYTEREFNLIREAVQEQITSTGRFSFHLYEWLQVPSLNRFTMLVLLRCLQRLVYQYVLFRNPLGFDSYLKQNGDTFFLSHDLLTQADQSFEYETKVAQSFPTDVHDIDRYETLHTDDIIMRLVQLSDSPEAQVYAERMWKAISASTRLSLTRRSIEREYLEHNTRPVNRFVLRVALHNEYELINGVPRVGRATLVDGQWREAVPAAAVDLQQQAREARDRLQAARLQLVDLWVAAGVADAQERGAFYVINTPAGMKISAFADIPRPSAKGQVCTTLQSDDLKVIAQSLAAPSDALPDERATKPQLCLMISQRAYARQLVISSEDHEVMKTHLSEKRARK